MRGVSKMDHLDRLENRSVHILREAYSEFARVQNLCMLWSIGKDSTVMLWLARKAFFGHVPFPLIHIDTNYKIPEMIKHRDRLALDWKLDMIYGQNKEALKKKETFPDGNATRIECCKKLKTEALINTLNGSSPRYRINHKTGLYELDKNREPYTGVIVGVRSDEEGSRSKERYFSPRNRSNNWDLEDQPPEFWNQYNPDFEPVLISGFIHYWTGLNLISGSISKKRIFRLYHYILTRGMELDIGLWGVHLVPIQ